MRGEILQDAHDARALHAVAVRGDGHVVHLAGNLDLASEVGHEDSRTAQHRDEDDSVVAGFFPEVFRDGSADFGDTIVNLLFGEQNLANVLMHVQSFDLIRQARLPSLL